MVISLVVGCRPQDDSWQRIEAAGILRVGLDPTFPPFESIQEGGLHGLDVDLVESLAETLGLTIIYSHFGYDGLYDALQTGQVDMLISALALVPERMEDFAYSQPYYDAGQVLISRQADEDIEGMENMASRRLAVELGSLGHVEALAWLQRESTMTVIPYPSAAEAIQAVVESEADGVVVDSVSGRLFLKELNSVDDLILHSELVSSEPFAIVVRKEDQELLNRLNNALNQSSNSGELDSIIKQWLGP